jgi:hypothetical protein
VSASQSENIGLAFLGLLSPSLFLFFVMYRCFIY